MGNPSYALVAALVWAFTPIYYRGFLSRFDVLSFNFLRNATAAAVLAVPALYLWEPSGLGFAVVSGVVTLACGDSLFLLSIRETSASVASPVVYTYVLMIQLAGVAMGQSIPYTNFLAAVMVVAGVYVLSRGGDGRPRSKGIALAVAAGVLWTFGQELIQQSTNAGGSFEAIAFTRNLSAAIALGAAFLLTRRDRAWPQNVGLKDYSVMIGFIVSDLVLGSLLFIYSISTIGVALTVILTSLSPLMTQVFAKALGKESPSTKDYLGGVLIVAALVLAVGI